MGMAGTVKSRADMLKEGPDGLPLESTEEEDEHHIDNFDGWSKLSGDGGVEGGAELTYMEGVWVVWERLVALDPDLMVQLMFSIAGALVLSLILEYFFLGDDEEKAKTTNEEGVAVAGAGSEAEEANAAAYTAVAQE